MAVGVLDPLKGILWQDSQMAPEDIALQRAALSKRRGQGIDTSPVGHWTQGAARVVDALGGVLQERRLDAAQSENDTYNRDIIDSLLPSLSGGSVPPSASSTGVGRDLSSTSPATIPQTEDAAALRQGLIDRGLPAHIADGFVANFQDESGLNPGINEASPLVPGSRGGYGLYQLTGPRRVSYEALAKSRGVDPSDTNTQLDFLGGELGLTGLGLENQPWFGSERAAYDNISRAGDTASAAQAIVNSFLRPSQEHRERRAASYVSLPDTADAASAIEAVAPSSGYVDPTVSAPNYQPSAEVANALVGTSSFDGSRFGGNAPEIYSAASDFVPEQPAPVNVASAPRAASVPAQIAQASPQRMGFDPRLLSVLSDPRANEQTRGVAQLLLQQQQAQMQSANEQNVWLQRQQYEREMQNSDPLRQAQIAKAQREAANGGESFFGNTVPVQNADGTISYGQIGNQGTFKPIQLPEGQTFAPPTRTIDTGTETILMDQTGNVISRTPKQNREAAAQTAQGSAEGKSTAETNSEYNSIVSKMPGLYGVVDRLSTLANESTYTTAGKALDTARSQLGLQPRDAAVARAEYTAIVDNQILPLLRDTFGAQFTNEEGLRLARTLGDADKTPTEKQALLRAFIEQKERDIQALGARTGQNQTPTQRPQATGNRLRFNPQTGELE